MSRLKTNIKIILISSLFSLYISNTWAFDFSEDSAKIKNHLQNFPQARLAVLFDESLQNDLKNRVDLVKLKAELTQALASKLSVTDPFYVEDYLNIQQSSSLELIENNQARIQASHNFDNSHFLYVTIALVDESKLIVIYSLYSGLDQKSFTFTKQHQLERSSPLQSQIDVAPVANVIDEIIKYRRPKLDELPWSYFHPTAYSNPQDRTFSLDSVLSAKNLGNSSLTIRQLRLDYQFLIFQVGFAEYFNVEGNRSAGYLNFKANFLNPENTPIPLYISIGIKTRYYLKYTEGFTNKPANQNTEKNKNSNKIESSIFLAANYKFNTIPLNIGLYLDRLYTGLDADWPLPYRFMLSFNILFPTLGADEEREKRLGISFSKPDQAFIARHLSTNYFNVYAGYHRLAETWLLGANINF